MDAVGPTCPRPSLGEVLIGEPVEIAVRSGTDPDSALKATQTPYTWEASDQCVRGRGEAFRLTLVCTQASDGTRRFYPAEERQAFLLKASVCGHAILARTYGMSSEQSFGYHAMRLIWQKAPRLSENLGRSFRRARDLHVTAPERVTQDVLDILPDELGRTANPESKKWAVSDLMEHGRAAAVQAGHVAPTEEQCIRFGLVEAARRNPIDMGQFSEAEAAGLVRTALFDLGPAQRRSDETTTDRVIERLLAAVERHLNDDADTFRQWFYEKASDLVRAIEKQRKAEGGPIERDQVRQVILDTVFRSYRYVGDCVHAQMRIFAKSLPTPLSDREQAQFEALYERQAYLGGLPLVLLYDYLEPLREIVLEILDNPTEQRVWGVLLRALQFHAEMVRNKRQSERQYKRQRDRSQNRNALPLETVPSPTAAGTPDNHASIADVLEDVAAELRRRRGAGCECGTLWDWQVLLDGVRSDEGMLLWTDKCQCCGHAESVVLSVDEARQLRHQLGERRATA